MQLGVRGNWCAKVILLRCLIWIWNAICHTGLCDPFSRYLSQSIMKGESLGVWNCGNALSLVVAATGRDKMGYYHQWVFIGWCVVMLGFRQHLISQQIISNAGEWLKILKCLNILYISGIGICPCGKNERILSLSCTECAEPPPSSVAAGEENRVSIWCRPPFPGWNFPLGSVQKLLITTARGKDQLKGANNSITTPGKEKKILVIYGRKKKVRGLSSFGWKSPGKDVAFYIFLAVSRKGLLPDCCLNVLFYYLCYLKRKCYKKMAYGRIESFSSIAFGQLHTGSAHRHN